MRLAKRMRHFWLRRRFESELAEEVRIHREMAEERLREEGAPEIVARETASRRFGNEGLALEASRSVWRMDWLEDLGQDARYAARSWTRSPGFAVTVVATIGLALGLNTALFTAFDHYVLRQLSVRDPGSLYQMEWNVKSGASQFLTWREFEGLRAQKDIVSGAYAALGVVGQIDQQPAWGQLVTPDFFEMLGARVAIGRAFTPADTPAPGTGAYIVLGNNCWKAKYGSDPNIIGRKVFVRGQPFEVIGVAAPEFPGIGPVPADFWVPLTMYAALNNGTDIFAPSKTGLLLAVIRLRSGVSLESAKAGLLTWVRRQTKDLPAGQRAVAVHLESRANAIPLTRDVLLAFAPVFIAFGLVLLTACANVSNMMLARALMRRREIGIRLSLGAGRPRLIRQLLTESFLLSLPAALTGFAVSALTVNGLRELFYRTVPSRFGKILQFPEMAPDYRVLGFVLLAAVGTTFLFGLIPALQATRSRAGFRPSRLRNAQVVAQVFVCALMLISSLIILKSETRIARRDLRMEPRGVLDYAFNRGSLLVLPKRYGRSR